jgi:hypothetical protein
LLQFAVGDALPWFGFGGQYAGGGPFVDFVFGSLREATGELLIPPIPPCLDKIVKIVLTIDANRIWGDNKALIGTRD